MRDPHEDGFKWSEIREQVFEMFADDGYYGRAIRAYERWKPADHGTFVNRLMVKVSNELEQLAEDNRFEAEDILLEEWADNAAYNKDPYAYYGVRRSDF